MGKINYDKTEEFEKDLKRLKRFKSLAEDLETVKKNAIELYHLHKLDNQSCFPIPGCGDENVQICKIKKFACRVMKGKGNRSGIRAIYAYFPKIDKIVFIEIYNKGYKENEDKERINEFLKNV